MGNFSVSLDWVRYRLTPAGRIPSSDFGMDLDALLWSRSDGDEKLRATLDFMVGFRVYSGGAVSFIKWPNFALGVSQRGWAEVRSLPSFEGLISVSESVWFANQAMMFSFGALHLIYGCYVIFIEKKRS